MFVVTELFNIAVNGLCAKKSAGADHHVNEMDFFLQNSDLLSSIGSQISLWLGMSIISGVEVIGFIGNILFTLFTGRKNKIVSKNTE